MIHLRLRAAWDAFCGRQPCCPATDPLWVPTPMALANPAAEHRIKMVMQAGMLQPSGKGWIMGSVVHCQESLLLSCANGIDPREIDAE